MFITKTISLSKHGKLASVIKAGYLLVYLLSYFLLRNIYNLITPHHRVQLNAFHHLIQPNTVEIG